MLVLAVMELGLTIYQPLQPLLSLVAVCIITVFCITPWVPKLLVLGIIWLLVQKWTWLIVALVGGYWYLRRPALQEALADKAEAEIIELDEKPAPQALAEKATDGAVAGDAKSKKED